MGCYVLSVSNARPRDPCRPKTQPAYRDYPQVPSRRSVITPPGQRLTADL
jgi:hypothetical protein